MGTKRKQKPKAKKLKAPSSRRTVSFAASPDRLLFGTVVGLTLFGLMMVASAGVVYGNVRFEDPYHFFKRQLFGVLLGFITLFVLQRIDYHVYRKWSFLMFCGSIVLLILVLVPGLGVEAYGARRWIDMGPLTLQPVEAVKLTIILYVSAWCASKGEKRIADFQEGFLPFLVIIGSVGFLVMKQPDMGTTGMITLIATTIFFLAGARLSHVLSLFMSGIVMLIILVKAAPYRLQRITAFLNPDLDPQGTGYQIKQALIAIGSGGFFGVGLGHSRQKSLYLPEPVGDSIFAIIAEEIGFVGVIVVIGIFLFLGWRVFRVAYYAPDLFGRLVASGIGVWLIGQAFMNIAAVTALMPLTGIPLTFISFGGTSIVFSLAAVGILLNISRHSTVRN